MESGDVKGSIVLVVLCFQVRLSPHLTLTKFLVKREEEGGESSDKQLMKCIWLYVCVCVLQPVQIQLLQLPVQLLLTE